MDVRVRAEVLRQTAAYLRDEAAAIADKSLALANVEIMREGHAQTLTVPPNVRYERLLRGGAGVVGEASERGTVTPSAR
jgi:hypothetical protein